jgi:hypothetical protein
LNFSNAPRGLVSDSVLLGLLALRVRLGLQGLRDRQVLLGRKARKGPLGHKGRKVISRSSIGVSLNAFPALLTPKPQSRLLRSVWTTASALRGRSLRQLYYRPVIIESIGPTVLITASGGPMGSLPYQP